jgi:hypothetical protein
LSLVARNGRKGYRRTMTVVAGEAGGFTTSDLDGTNVVDVVCLRVPDDVIPALQIEPRPDAAVILASAYTIACEADLRSRLGGRADTNQPS